jgi:hypothetical protein
MPHLTCTSSANSGQQHVYKITCAIYGGKSS